MFFLDTDTALDTAPTPIPDGKLLNPRRPGKKPVGPVEIDKHHKLGKVCEGMLMAGPAFPENLPLNDKGSGTVLSAGGYYFDGSASYIRVEDARDRFLAPSFTIVFDLEIHSYSNADRLVTKKSDFGGDGWAVEVKTVSSQQSLQFYCDGLRWTAICSFPVGRFQYIATFKDFDYIASAVVQSGVVYDSDSLTTGIGEVGQTLPGNPMYIGRYASGGSMPEFTLYGFYYLSEATPISDLVSTAADPYQFLKPKYTALPILPRWDAERGPMPVVDSRLLDRRRPGKKPVGPVEINAKHKFAPDYYWHCTDGRELVSGNNATFGAGCAAAPDGIDMDGTSAASSLLDADIDMGLYYTAFIDFYPRAFGDLVFGGNVGGGNYAAYWVSGSIYTSASGNFNPASYTMPLNKRVRMAVVREYATVYAYLLFDGQRVELTLDPFQTTIFTVSRLSGLDGGEYTLDGVLHSCGIIKKTLSKGQCFELLSDPYQFLKPKTKPIPLPRYIPGTTLPDRRWEKPRGLRPGVKPTWPVEVDCDSQILKGKIDAVYLLNNERDTTDQHNLTNNGAEFVVGGALFDGADYLDNSGWFQVTDHTEYTVIAVFTPTASGETGQVFSARSGASDSRYYIYMSGGDIQIGGGSIGSQSLSHTLSSGERAVVANVKSGGTFKGYVNGEFKAQITGASFGTYNQYQCKIGNYAVSATSGNTFNGVVECVFMIPRALSDSEIAALTRSLYQFLIPK